MPEHQPIVYAGHERPDVEVLVDGQWLPGEVRMVAWDDNGHARHQVQYRPVGTTSSVIATFTDDQVREDTVDRSRGRSPSTQSGGGSTVEGPRGARTAPSG